MHYCMINAVLIFLISLVGAFVLRVCGFGFGIFTMTWLPFLLPTYAEATTLSGILAMSGSIIMTSKNWRYIDWHKLTPILIIFIVSSCASIQFVSNTSDDFLKRLLGIMLTIAGAWFLIISKHVNIRPTLFMQVLMGAISGFMGGAFAMHGPAAALYFLACSNDKNEYVALTMSYLLIGNIMMLAFRIQNGFLTETICYAFLYVAVGIWIGNKVFYKLSTDWVKKLSYAYISISGIVELIISWN